MHDNHTPQATAQQPAAIRQDKTVTPGPAEETSASPLSSGLSAPGQPGGSEASHGESQPPHPAAPSSQSGPAPSQQPPPARPYFMPDDVQYGDLSPGLQAALESMIVPTSEKLVAGESDPIAQLSGATATFEAFLEVYWQEKLTGEVLSPACDPAELERLLRHHGRTVQRKLQAANLLLRVKAAQRNQGILGGRYA